LGLGRSSIEGLIARGLLPTVRFDGVRRVLLDVRDLDDLVLRTKASRP
jgi:hypothetical protein